MTRITRMLVENSAGTQEIFDFRTTPPAPIDEIPLEDWRAALAVNLDSMFLSARAAFGQMRRQVPQGGRIINNGSISAHVPRPHTAPYTATKHAVTALGRALGIDTLGTGVRVSSVDPGMVDTVTWTNPQPGTYPNLTSNDPADPLANTSP